ncbi:MAG: endonuclease III [Acholeplasmataceae bacterium]|nr:endonuclease III [Acholeplasmataceae bacterium]
MSQKTDKILQVLDQMFPNAHVELHHQNTFELIVAVVLSAQTTDVAVNLVTPTLFKRYPNPKSLSEANISDVEHILKTIGLYRNKAKNIIALANEIHHKYHDEVPNERTKLEALPGVGRKTANVVLSNAFNIPALAVDTHVARVSIRLKLAKKEDSVLEIEHKLMKKFPKSVWTKLHHQLIFFGRYHCLARVPKCQECPLYEICGYEKKTKI